MSLEQVRSEVGSIVSGTRWSVTSSSSGPVELTHADGSELSVVDAPATSTLRLDYDPVDGNSSFKDSPIRDGSADNILEWVEHIATKHDQEN